ncbi:MAG: hypothetical protein Q3M24_22830 [Candidatus Electrothrix aestuarii]|uniref:Uncharacterized protein n=1 Tax=Candidatus Electrothrix aestuarii TaxID=3062594 RepID=A0AAU8LW16_9BACT|nr:hypothetical protein [Candidatus Electrothrix aestuarii]
MRIASKEESKSIHELKEKLYYAESASNAYKEIDFGLYETNLFYIEALKLQLHHLEKELEQGEL